MKRTGLGLAVLCALLLGGCDTGAHQRLNCICLIDYSGSLSEETLHRYVEIISSDVLQRLGERDRLVVLPIDEGAKTEAVKLYYDDRAEKKFTQQTDGYAHASDSLLMRLKRYAGTTGPVIATQLLREKTLRQKYTYLTDIFAALEQASALLERNEPESFWRGVERFVTGKKRMESTNAIILFSDMIQESRETTFADSNGVSDEKARDVMDKLRAWNRIPDLHGCRVFVNGRTGKNNVQVESIKNFWTKYFKESGAELAAYDYDAGPQIASFLAQRMAALR
jgi:hypothetical protein